MSDFSHTPPPTSAPSSPERQVDDQIPGQLLQSAGAATFSTVWRMVVSLGSLMVVRRFVPPDELGVWEWALPVFVLLSQFRDLGLPAHIARQETRHYGDYLRIIVIWGGSFAALLALGAPILATAFVGRGPETVAILRWLCLFLFVQGLGVLPLTYLDIERQTVRTIPAELIRNALMAGISVGLAWKGFGVWSVVAGHIVASLVYSSMLWAATYREIPLLRGGPGSWKLLVWTGIPLMVMSILELAVLNLDPLVLGARLPAAAVGEAGLAIMAVFLLSRQIADSSGRVLYPAMVRYREEPKVAFELYGIATLVLSSLVAGGAFALFWSAETIALILGGDQWLGAAPYIRVAAFVPFARPLTMFGRELLLIYYRDKLLIAYTLVNLVAMGTLGWILTGTELGALGMAVAGYFALGQLLLAWGLHQVDPAGFWTLVGRLFQVYALTALVFLPVALIPQEQLWLRFGACAVAGVVGMSLVTLRFQKLYRRFFALR